MRVFRGFDELPHFRCGVATIGSFDGVHSGHRILLDTVESLARQHGGESIVLTFEPHPRITLGCAEGLKLLTTTEEKLVLLERAGVENVIIIPFTVEFSRLTPQRFLEEYIRGKAGISYLVVGYNHHFGRDKSGDFNYLSSSGEELGLHVVQVAQHLVDKFKVSSTIIRRLIAAGDMEEADKLLGSRYMLMGMMDCTGAVVSPDREYKLLPPAGEYDVLADGKPAKATVDAGGRLHVDGLSGKTERVTIEF